ncbi:MULTISPECIES: Y-family DNA polymerase [unclassified Enterococcus]|uniref:Y-family DNA polymerase n=1 Tax=unclassified Enterococcus TaxID=2608891 RepID=UPI001CE19ACA|nr:MULTISPECIES: Y-family DNA polymerase [unclassified Enterococcus]MCA5014530.1 Y-family DNA polymerase [Enterococcus sp. S23]MCA5017783.1 Y-family DNA polymerase [Enterococcus sp. S22(2020)]
MKFDYSKEPSRDILCIDCKSFYASVECVERGLHPLKTMLIVMSGAENSGGLVLAASPLAKKVLGISNVTRSNEVPYHKDLLIVPPRMSYYMAKNVEINQIYKSFVADEDHAVFSVDESFLDVTNSLKLFGCKNAYEMAQLIQRKVKDQTGIYVTIGIGDQPLLAKLALDLESKCSKDFIAEWRYEDVQEKVWNIHPMTEFCGIGNRTAKRLNLMGIRTIKEIAEADPYRLKREFGVMGLQLYAHAWGIDRSFLGQRKPAAKVDKSIGNSQVLPRDYTRQDQLELVLKEIADQVATRLRSSHLKTGCVAVSVGYSKGYIDKQGRSGWRKQMKIQLSNNTKTLSDYVLQLFRSEYNGQDVRHVGISYSKLEKTDSLQLDLFSDPEEEFSEQRLDFLIDAIRKKYGFKSLIHASSLLDGATAVSRSGLVAGHAGGNVGVQ